ncbi:MAG: tetratricopeptide repeat protein [Acidobacteria bacterium]|nr:tetratricopeptide repeat protein [Acidobacteriota bacterium]MCI0717566.1 tetratricopeptide repeat protein [Acidobacteriota bacterium]
MYESLALLTRRSEQPATMPDLLQRYGRVLLESGKPDDAFRAFNQALEGYQRFPGAFGPDVERLLFLDLTDALASLNRLPEAENYWPYLVENSMPGSIPQQIARCRLAGKTEREECKGALAAAIHDAGENPGHGELLRRAQWTSNQLELQRQ